jgi:FkbM family methyltransferase
MEENLRSLPNAMKIKAALAANNGVARFIRHSSNTGRLDIDNSKESVQVKIVRIGDVLPQHWDLAATYVKLDIEGAEYQVLPDTLKSGIRPAILVAEIHDFIRMGGQRLIDKLQGAGYAVEVDGCGMEGYVCRQVFARLN